MIGTLRGHSAPADGWGSALCMMNLKPSFLVDTNKDLFYCYGFVASSRAQRTASARRRMPDKSLASVTEAESRYTWRAYCG
jgi:hypothetical protein